MTADMTRQEVRFIRWDVPTRKQEDLLDAVKDSAICPECVEKKVE